MRRHAPTRRCSRWRFGRARWWRTCARWRLGHARQLRALRGGRLDPRAGGGAGPARPALRGGALVHGPPPGHEPGRAGKLPQPPEHGRPVSRRPAGADGRGVARRARTRRRASGVADRGGRQARRLVETPAMPTAPGPWLASRTRRPPGLRPRQRPALEPRHRGRGRWPQVAGPRAHPLGTRSDARRRRAVVLPARRGEPARLARAPRWRAGPASRCTRPSFTGATRASRSTSTSRWPRATTSRCGGSRSTTRPIGPGG